MTTPNIISQILEALDNNPELEAALRQRILTQELLALPEQVAQLAATVANMARVFEQRLAALEAKQDAMQAQLDAVVAKQDAMQAQLDAVVAKQDAMQGQLDAVVAKQDTMQGQLDAVVAKQDTMQGQLNSITGTDYERLAVRRAPRLVRRHLGVQNAEVMMAINRQNGRAITDLVNEAAQSGAITEDDADDLDRADIILQGNSPDGDGIYVIAEVSITIDETDIDRSHQRARILHNASSATTHAAVIGTSISDANREHARSSRVTVITLID